MAKRPKGARRPVTPTSAPRTPGYRPMPQRVEVTCDWPELAPDDGCPPLTATLVKNLTFEQIDHIPMPVKMGDEGQLMILADDHLRQAIAPYVLAWNAEAIDLATGESVPVPPPAEIGPDAFRAVDWRIGSWLGLTLKTIHRRQPDLPKDGPPSASTPATVSE